MIADNLEIMDTLSIDELLHRSKKYRNSKEFVKFFDFITSLNHYSRYNTMLVYLQNDEVTFFGGASFWRKNYNRKVKENARPYVILAPMCPVRVVYDIMETEGNESPEEFLTKGLGAAPFEVKGECSEELLHNIIKVAEDYCLRVLFQEQSFFKGGHLSWVDIHDVQIVLNVNSPLEVKFSTMIHELAHLFLGHSDVKELYVQSTKKKKNLKQRRLSMNAKEMEAETVSFLVCKRHGLETRSAEYIGGYIKEDDDLCEFSYESVIKTADMIDKLILSELIKQKERERDLNFRPVHI